MTTLRESDIRQALKKLAPPPQAAHIRTPREVEAEVIAAFHDDSFGTQGYPIQFEGFEHCLRFRKGEVTVWTGENYTGKSEALNQFLLSQTGVEKSFIMSPEMPVYRTMQYMCQQIFKSERPSKDQIKNFLELVSDKIYLLDQQSTFNPEDVLKLIQYVHAEFGVFHIVIDSLMKCGINENDDHAKVKWFVDQLCVIAKNLGIHIHLVAHAKKPDRGGRPSRYNIKGSGSTPDLVDNVVIMWRNQDKERELDEGGYDDQRYAELMDMPDARMIIDKQRHGNSWSGSIALWHDAVSRSFMTTRSGYINKKPTNTNQ